MATRVRLKTVIPVDSLGDVPVQITRDAGGRISLYVFEYLSLRASYTITYVGDTAEVDTFTPLYESVVT